MQTIINNIINNDELCIKLGLEPGNGVIPALYSLLCKVKESIWFNAQVTYEINTDYWHPVIYFNNGIEIIDFNSYTSAVQFMRKHRLMDQYGEVELDIDSILEPLKADEDAMVEAMIEIQELET